MRFRNSRAMLDRGAIPGWFVQPLDGRRFGSRTETTSRVPRLPPTCVSPPPTPIPRGGARPRAPFPRCGPSRSHRAKSRRRDDRRAACEPPSGEVAAAVRAMAQDISMPVPVYRPAWRLSGRRRRSPAADIDDASRRDPCGDQPAQFVARRNPVKPVGQAARDSHAETSPRVRRPTVSGEVRESDAW